MLFRFGPSERRTLSAENSKLAGASQQDSLQAKGGVWNSRKKKGGNPGQFLRGGKAGKVILPHGLDTQPKNRIYGQRTCCKVREVSK